MEKLKFLFLSEADDRRFWAANHQAAFANRNILVPPERTGVAAMFFPQAKAKW